jgi:hypothetical protein
MKGLYCAGRIFELMRPMQSHSYTWTIIWLLSWKKVRNPDENSDLPPRPIPSDKRALLRRED